ncbi:carboxypeptidase-like regulatory domain-containing protein [Fulvivirgaceae bacterium BMA10]|uniref:Carboxypeptidase-like regulatory domain-containing protein n=1 Tax=Splendidivirga corallicola TaxID=3051826 RepID=A0ABT8KRC2_9BACT|nr:carboxypeptidase-like regulatory domain-containing protein [Fulvivirgaceae bacterium BMA10]
MNKESVKCFLFAKPVILVFFSLLFGTIFTIESKAQEKQILQFSGVVVGEDSVSGVPGVHIYVPKARRGTSTNFYGYFSMPVLAGDSIIISAVGYQRQSYIVAQSQKEDITEIFELKLDTTYLEEVEIFPFPTEKEFKEAVLALKLPSEDLNDDGLSAEVLSEMAATLPLDGQEGYYNFVNQQFYSTHNRYTYQPNALGALLNPFAWSQFIKSIKRGDFKKKKK